MSLHPLQSHAGVTWSPSPSQRWSGMSLITTGAWGLRHPGGTQGRSRELLWGGSFPSLGITTARLPLSVRTAPALSCPTAQPGLSFIGPEGPCLRLRRSDAAQLDPDLTLALSWPQSSARNYTREQCLPHPPLEFLSGSLFLASPPCPSDSGRGTRPDSHHGACLA